MKIKKINALLSLLTTLALLVHIGYQSYAYLTMYYNPQLKTLTALPFIVLTCVHAILGMSLVFLLGDGTRLNLYAKINIRTILQRLSAALIFPLLILHLNTYSLLKSTSTDGQWFPFVLLLICQTLFYGVAITHAAVSFSRALITLGWLTTKRRQKKVDLVSYILWAVVFAVAIYAVVSCEISMFVH